MATKKTKEEYWLFTLSINGSVANVYCDVFPTREILESTIKAKRFKILFFSKLTKEQYDALKPEEVE